jgi:hypothetical protein
MGEEAEARSEESPEDLACQRNYYALKKEDGTWDDSIEELIGSTVEAPGLPVIQKLASGKTRLTWQERDRVSLLIAFQEMRTPSARERAREFSDPVRNGRPGAFWADPASELGDFLVNLPRKRRSYRRTCPSVI